MKKQIDDFVSLCQHIGVRSDYVQGAGGNISIKYDTNRMAIKASGIQLDQVNKNTGIAYLDISGFYDELMACQTEHAYNQLIATQTQKHQSSERASMETGFHAILGPVVLHTHNVYSNCFLCSDKGIDQIKTLLPNAIVIDYKTPGLELSKAIGLIAKSHLQKTTVFLLKNHGIIISGSHIEDVNDVHEKITQRLKKASHLFDYPELKIVSDGDRYSGETPQLTQWMKRYGDDWLAQRILFPDQAIYFKPSSLKLTATSRSYASMKEAIAYESLLLSIYIIQNYNATQEWQSAYLSEAQTSTLCHLSSEKYRQEKIK